MRHLKKILSLLPLFPILIVYQLPAFSQQSNFLHPICEIERRLNHEDFELFRFSDLRFEGDIAKRAILKFIDVKYMQVKWRRARPGAEEFNNQPRYEVAAYQLQKLFLDEDEYVVPPTVIRGFPFSLYKKMEKYANATFRKPNMVFVVLQYWMEQVSSDDVFDQKRFETDSAYTRHLGNANIFSYLIRHSDSNKGNFLISKIKSNPRVYAVDNGVAFASEESNRGTKWRKLRVKKLPAKTIARLREVTLEDLRSALGVVAQFDVKNGCIKNTARTENLNPKRGVRRKDNIIQFGLNEREIKDIWSRLEKLIKRVDSGDIATF